MPRVKRGTKARKRHKKITTFARLYQPRPEAVLRTSTV